MRLFSRLLSGVLVLVSAATVYGQPQPPYLGGTGCSSPVVENQLASNVNNGAGTACWVTNGDTATDCDGTGSGSNLVLCYYNGSTWTAFGGGGGGTITAVGPGCSTGACLTNGLVTSGTGVFVWEGTSVDANDLTLSVDVANPTTNPNLIFPVPATGSWYFTIDATSITNVDGAGLAISASTLDVVAGTGVVVASDLVALKYSDALAANPTFNAEECVFSTDGTGGGGFLCEGNTGGNTNEQLYLFPAVDGVDVTSFIAVDDKQVTNLEGAALTISAGVLSVTAAQSGVSGTIELDNALSGSNTDVELASGVAGAGLTLNTATIPDSLDVSAGTGLAVASDLVAIKFSDTLAGNPTFNAEECVHTTDGTGGGGFLCEGNTGGNTNEQLYLFPAVDGVDTTNFITVDATQITDVDGNGLAIASGVLGVGVGLGLSVAADAVNIDYSKSLASNVAMGAGECIFTSVGSANGGFLCEGTVGGADNNETYFVFPSVTSELTYNLALGDTNGVASDTNAIRGFNVSATGPSVDGQILEWNTAANEWKPDVTLRGAYQFSNLLTINTQATGGVALTIQPDNASTSIGLNLINEAGTDLYRLYGSATGAYSFACADSAADWSEATSITSASPQAYGNQFAKTVGGVMSWYDGGYCNYDYETLCMTNTDCANRCASDYTPDTFTVSAGTAANPCVLTMAADQTDWLNGTRVNITGIAGGYGTAANGFRYISRTGTGTYALYSDQAMTTGIDCTGQTYSSGGSVALASGITIAPCCTAANTGSTCQCTGQITKNQISPVNETQVSTSQGFDGAMRTIAYNYNQGAVNKTQSLRTWGRIQKSVCNFTATGGGDFQCTNNSDCSNLCTANTDIMSASFTNSDAACTAANTCATCQCLQVVPGVGFGTDWVMGLDSSADAEATAFSLRGEWQDPTTGSFDSIARFFVRNNNNTPEVLDLDGLNMKVVALVNVDIGTNSLFLNDGGAKTLTPTELASVDTGGNLRTRNCHALLETPKLTDDGFAFCYLPNAGTVTSISCLVTGTFSPAAPQMQAFLRPGSAPVSGGTALNTACTCGTTLTTCTLSGSPGLTAGQLISFDVVNTPTSVADEFVEMVVNYTVP